jgi:hypothetical protein
MEAKSFVAELIDTQDLKPHPRNYQQHPDYQLRHIIKSIETHGFYRNVVVAKDNTILAGHGVVEAATRLGITQIPVHRVDLMPDDTKALQILTGDNEINNLAVVNDRMLTELLKEIALDDTAGLIGSGFDENQLATLAMITRPAHEIKDKDEAAEWLGMPDLEIEKPSIRLIVHFDNETDREEFAKLIGYKFTENTKSIWYPQRERDDVTSVEFVG